MESVGVVRYLVILVPSEPSRMTLHIMTGRVEWCPVRADRLRVVFGGPAGGGTGFAGGELARRIDGVQWFRMQLLCGSCLRSWGLSWGCFDVRQSIRPFTIACGYPEFRAVALQRSAPAANNFQTSIRRLVSKLSVNELTIHAPR